jgi:DNA-binding response OmpR family regulator
VTNNENGKIRLLVVDDDVELCRELSDMLRDEGYAVDVLNDPVKGLAAVQDPKYRAIMLDLKMPGLSGYDILESLREKGVKTPVIIITGNPLDGVGPDKTGADARQRRLMEMADAVMNKPFDVPALLSSLKKLARTPNP